MDENSRHSRSMRSMSHDGSNPSYDENDRKFSESNIHDLGGNPTYQQFDR
jgi:hypothetical protein